MRKSHVLGVLPTCAMVAGLSGLVPANAQNFPSGIQLTFGLSSSLRVNDNLGLDDPAPGTSTLWDNALSFGLLNETALDRLSLELTGVLRIADIPGSSEDLDFDDPGISLAYAREGANSRLETGARYNQVDLSFTDPLRLVLEDINNDGTIDSNDVINDRGTRKTGIFNFSFETGLNDPLGFGVALRYNQRRYSDTTDPGLFDTDTYSTEIFTRFRLSSVAEGRLVYSHETYDAEDAAQEERKTDDARFELTHAYNPITTLNAMIGYRDIKETTNLPLVTSEEGLIGSIGLTRELANGSAGVNLDSDLTISGRRNTLSFSREMVLPNGTIAASIGAAHNDRRDDTELVGNFEYLHQFPNSVVTVGLRRDARTDNEGDDIISTRAGVAYETGLTSVSALLFELNFVEVENLTLGAPDRSEATTFRATYTRNLTPDWGLAIGYEYRTFDETNDSFRDSNEIFLTISREFSIRP